MVGKWRDLAAKCDKRWRVESFCDTVKMVCRGFSGN